MTRYINLAAIKKKVAAKDSYKGQPVVGVKAIASVKGKEQVGDIVYRRKVEYSAPFEN